jgi:hypothetical protein
VQNDFFNSIDHQLPLAVGGERVRYAPISGHRSCALALRVCAISRPEQVQQSALSLLLFGRLLFGWRLLAGDDPDGRLEVATIEELNKADCAFASFRASPAIKHLISEMHGEAIIAAAVWARPD